MGEKEHDPWADLDGHLLSHVPSGKGAQVIIALVESRETGLLQGASFVFKGKKQTGDYHGEMNSAVWLKWLPDKLFPKICGGVLVVDRAPYHMNLVDNSRPATSSTSAETWERYEDHPISMEDYCMELAAMSAEVEDRIDEMDIDMEDSEADGVNGRDEEGEEEGGRG